MNIPEEEVNNHFDKLFEAVENPVEKVSVVPLENFDIDENFEPKGEIQQKYEEIENKYDLNIVEEKTEAIKEFESWGKENGYENVWSSLSQEKLDNPFSALESHELKGIMNQEIYGKYLVNELEERGYNIDELKDNKEKAIDAIFDFTVERQGMEDNEDKKDAFRIGLEGWANHTDNLEKVLNGQEVDCLPFTIDFFENSPDQESHENFRQELVKDSLEKYGYSIERLNEITEKNPTEIIPIISDLVKNEFNEENGFDGSDQSKIFMGIKHTLTEMGIENLDKFVVIESTNEDGHAVSKLITIKDGEFIVSSVDFNSIGDESIAEEDISEKVEKAHSSVLDKIKELNIKDRLKNFFEGEK